METILVESQGSFYALCPRCGQLCDDVETDDYISENCLFWCKSLGPGACGERLICPSGASCARPPGDISLMAAAPRGAAPRGCSVEISREEAEGFARLRLGPAACGPAGLAALPEAPPESDAQLRFFLVGIVAVSHLGGRCDAAPHCCFERGCGPVLTRLPQPVECFGDIPEGISRGHADRRLAYRGRCQRCGRRCEGEIWGAWLAKNEDGASLAKDGSD